MATKKVYKKDKLVTSIDELVKNKHRHFIIVDDNRNINCSYLKLAIMALFTIDINIRNNNLYYAIIVEEEIIRKTKTKVVPKEKSDIGGCKVSLADIYDSVKDHC